jgi:hypothetical protein
MVTDGPVVIDLGNDRALDASGTMTSAVSQVVGTPAFMAPEQLAEGTIGPHTDMFAWAITMVYAASGVPAFGHRSIPQVINRILHAEPDLGALDGRLRPVVAACLAKDPSRRPTARQLMDELMGHNASAPAFAAASHPGTPAGAPIPPGGSHGAEPMRLPASGLPASGRPPSGGPPGSSGFPDSAGHPGFAGRPPRRKGRTALIVGAVVAVLVALIAGIGALASSRGPEKNRQAAAPPPSPRHSRRPAKHHTPSPSRTPSRRPAAAKSVRANPYTPQRLCGSGYRVVDAHGLGEARTYLLYNTHAGTNCVVTMVPRSSGKVFLTASLVVQGGSRDSRSGSFPFYAGPIRLPARGKCVMWGGASKTARWTSGWSHCGK